MIHQDWLNQKTVKKSLTVEGLELPYLIIILKPHHNSCCEFIRSRSCFFFAFKNMNRIPWSCWCCISSLLYQNYTGESMVQIPQINRAESYSMIHTSISADCFFCLTWHRLRNTFLGIDWMHHSFQFQVFGDTPTVQHWIKVNRNFGWFLFRLTRHLVVDHIFQTMVICTNHRHDYNHRVNSLYQSIIIVMKVQKAK